MSYPIAGMVKKFQADEYSADHPIVVILFMTITCTVFNIVIVGVGIFQISDPLIFKGYHPRLTCEKIARKCVLSCVTKEFVIPW